MIGQSALLLSLQEQLSGLATLNKPVLVLGERGTGKELVAERLHYLSPRWDQPFIKVNCAAMSESLLESELFGHEVGAFTGAVKTHQGRFERADGGTLFLDELASCSSRVQEKLLRVIEYGEFERLGGSKVLHVEVRLVAATNEDVCQLASQGSFRADLLDRLAFDVIHVPALRLRKDDIPLLAEHFALTMCHELNYPFFAGFTDQAMAQLQQHDWPGNIRELKNVTERSIYRNSQSEEAVSEIVIDPFQPPWSKIDQSGSADYPLSDTSPSAPATLSLQHQLRNTEQQLILQALEQCHYNQRQTATRLGLSYPQLRAALKRFEMLPLKKYLAEMS
ncbi:MAG: phage shock protein operon transcriptional activator [Amphritea sp.]